MMRPLLILLLTFSFQPGGHARELTSYFQLRNRASDLSQKELLEWVNGLVAASSPSRMIGRPGHLKARKWLQEEIAKLDPDGRGQLTVQEFSPNVSAAHFKRLEARSQQAVRGQNILWVKKGERESKLVITAHYDTFAKSEVSPGANYNASGVAVALGLIRNLAPLKLKHTVEVVFLDWQGMGLLGSLHHAEGLSSDQVLGVLNLERLGQDSTYFDQQKKLGNMRVYAKSEHRGWAEKLLRHGGELTSKVSFELTPKLLPESDFIRYAERGIPAASFAQNFEDDFNPKFHLSPDDTPETLNHSTLYHAYLFVSGVVLGTLLEINK
jgi:hypothetical protein